YPSGLHGVVYRLSGEVLTSWTFASSTGIRKIRGTSADDVWIVGGVGAVSHWTGAEWQGETVPMQGPDGYTVDLEIVGPGDVWLSLGGGVYHRTSGTWQPVDVPATYFHRAGHGELLAGCAGELWFAPDDGGAPERLTIGPRQANVALWGTAAD